MSRSIRTDTGREAADGARGTTDYSHQWHICETTTVSMHDLVLSILDVIVSSCHQPSAEYINVVLPVNLGPSVCLDF